VTVCRDGESGLQTAESIGFDVIFMDIDLPKMNGKDVMRAIRAGTGPNMNAPLIAFTAFAIRSQKDEIMASGADTILANPISAREDFEVALSTTFFVGR
jgi:CheY-like chemotaxis protein